MRFARSDPGRELQARLTRQSMAVRRLELPSGLRLGAAGGGLSCVRETMDHGLRRCVWSQRSGMLAAQGVNADKLSDELFLAQEWLGLVESKSLMGNVYLDLPGVAVGFTPFVGLGMGKIIWVVAGTTHWLGSPDQARRHHQFSREYLGPACD